MSRLGRAAACALALAAAGCTSDDTSPSSEPQPIGGGGQPGPMPGAQGAAQAGGSSGATMAAGGSAGTAMPERSWPSCGEAFDDQDGGVSPYDDACAIDERFGVFVDPTGGDDASADGSRNHPFASLQPAIALAVNENKRVYACAGEYTEPVRIGTSISDGLQLLGGLSCETFTVDPNGARSIVRASGGGAALLIADTRAIRIERFDFESVAEQSSPGATHIGAFIQNARSVVLRDVALRAAHGERGADGEPPDESAAGDGVDGSDGARACAANPNPGGTGGGNRACAMPPTPGGAGGPGGIGTGNGGNGFWYGSPSISGESATGWSCTQGSGMAYPPQMAFPAQPGRGGTGFGAIVGTSFIGFSGQDGFDGTPGQGGGGGGGARAPSSCSGLATATGASGGGGGGGGCGGEGGDAGGAGGSSIGLIAVDAGVRLERGSISYGNGGDGGNGAMGQAGGRGGAAGLGGQGSGGSRAACAGTMGGNGGSGGPGGGGNGGHAIGVLHVGRAPLLVEVAGEAEAAELSGGDPGQGPEGVEPTLAPMMTGTPGEAAFIFEF